MYLLPDKTKSGKRKTKVKKHTLNPAFDEILKVSGKALEGRKVSQFGDPEKPQRLRHNDAISPRAQCPHLLAMIKT